jgi:hypothetical protein
VEGADGGSAYLMAEVREARAAVAAMDRYLFRVKSFKDSSFELVEQAHLAMSRLEQVRVSAAGAAPAAGQGHGTGLGGGLALGAGAAAGHGGVSAGLPLLRVRRRAAPTPIRSPHDPPLQAVATRPAPELIVVACEVKVAARRGADLLRTYGQYHFLGKLVAVAQRGRVAAKYTRVTARLRGLMPAAPPGAMPPSPTASASPFQAIASGSGSGGAGAGAGATADRSVAGAAGGGAGQVLKRGHHERVQSIAFAPAAVAAASGGLCVWWSSDAGVEFYSDAAQSTTSFATEGGVFLTAVAIDVAGNTWGGTSGGTLLMRRPRVWDSQAEERLFGSAVRAIAFGDDGGAVWAGDDAGCLRAARFHPDSGRIHPLLTALAGRASRRGFSTGALLGSGRRVTTAGEGAGVQRALAGGSVQPPMSLSLASAAAANRNPTPLAARSGCSCGALHPAAMQTTRSPAWRAPSAALRCATTVSGQLGAARSPGSRCSAPAQVRCFAARGHWPAACGLLSRIQLLAVQDSFCFLHELAHASNRSYRHGPGQQLDVWRCGGHGACTCMQLISWASQPSRGGTSSGLISHAGSTALSAEMRGWSSGGALAVGASMPAPVPEGSAVDNVRGPAQLLSGHENGQVLVWNAASDRLAPACKLGDPGSPVRAVASLDAWGLVATAHANGELALFARPAAATDWGGGILSGATSYALTSAGSTQSSCAGGAGGLQPHTTSVGAPTVRPRRAVVRAHRHSIVAAGGSASGVVTASNTGTLRLWRAAELAREAERAGILCGAVAGRGTTASAAMSAVSSERCAPS